MLNIIPIQFLAPLAYMFLRICLGFIFIYFGHSHIKNRKTKEKMFFPKRLPYGSFFIWYIALLEIVIGILFILGLLTQVAAFVAMVYALKFITTHTPNKIVYVFIFFISLSLFITGAGIFAFDLPI